MLNKIGAVVIGIIGGSIIVSLIEYINTSIFPLPEGVDMNNFETLREYVASASPEKFIGVIVAHAIGALVGGFLASYIAKTQKNRMALITGIIFLLFGIANIVLLHTQAWFIVLDCLVYVPMALLGHRIATNFQKN